MKIIVTGGTGFLGRASIAYLDALGHECTAVSRHPAGAVVAGARAVVGWGHLPPCDAILHLAGEPVVGLWTPAKRRAILTSRVESTRALVQAMREMPTPPRVLLSASAIGWYGHRPGEEITEDSGPDPRRAFRWKVCDAWEHEAAAAAELGCRVVSLRISNIMDPAGGFLGGLLPVYRRFGCWVLGRSDSAVSWVSMEDACRLIGFALERENIEGVLNVSSPHPITQRHLASGLAQQLGKPVRGRIPSGLLRAALGEFSSAILDDQRVLPARAEAHGFRFHSPAWRGWLLEHLDAVQTPDC